MKELLIGNQKLNIKDYGCSCFGKNEYFFNANAKLWLYVNLTDACPGHCAFCINPSHGTMAGNPFDLSRYEACLWEIAPHVRGVSFTGGEPLLDIELFERVLDMTLCVFAERRDADAGSGDFLEIDAVTNGVNLRALAQLRNVDQLTSLHISRHAVSDEVNASLFGWQAPTLEELRSFMHKLVDPGAVVLNCVLQRSGVHSLNDVAEYLEMAASLGIGAASFIGLAQINDYCFREFVNPATLDFAGDNRFRVVNHYQDYDFCSCSAGDYKAEQGNVCYYYRIPGRRCSAYTRQLVYTADNRLLAGFGGPEISVKFNTVL